MSKTSGQKTIFGDYFDVLPEDSNFHDRRGEPLQELPAASAMAAKCFHCGKRGRLWVKELHGTRGIPWRVLACQKCNDCPECFERLEVK